MVRQHPFGAVRPGPTKDAIADYHGVGSTELTDFVWIYVFFAGMMAWWPARRILHPRELDIYLYDGRICQEEKSEKSVCMLFDDACSVVTVPPTDTRSYDYEYTAPLEAHLAASPLYLHPEERNSSPFTWSTWLVMSLQGRGLAYPSISGIISGIIECARMWLLPLADFELRTPVRVIKDDDVSAQDVLPAHVMFSVDVPEQELKPGDRIEFRDMRMVMNPNIPPQTGTINTIHQFERSGTVLRVMERNHGGDFVSYSSVKLTHIWNSSTGNYDDNPSAMWRRLDSFTLIDGIAGASIPKPTEDAYLAVKRSYQNISKALDLVQPPS